MPFSLVFEFLSNGEMIKNVPVNGTIPKGESVSYTSKAGNWEYVTFGIQVTGYGRFHPPHS